MRTALVVAACAGAGLAGCGGEDSDGSVGDLRWTSEPKVYESTEVARTRILIGRVRNSSLERLRLESADLRMTDADGEAVDADFGFVGAYARPDQPRNRSEEGLPESERERVGQAARVEPGKEVALSASWRVSARVSPPLRIEHPAGILEVPRATVR